MVLRVPRRDAGEPVAVERAVGGHEPRVRDRRVDGGGIGVHQAPPRCQGDRLWAVQPAARVDLPGLQVEIGARSPARGHEPGAGGRLVRGLVLAEAHVAVDPEGRPGRVGRERQAARREPVGERCAKRLEGNLQQPLVLGLAGREPGAVVVRCEVREEGDRLRAEALERRRRGHGVSSVILLGAWRRHRIASGRRGRIVPSTELRRHADAPARPRVAAARRSRTSCGAAPASTPAARAVSSARGSPPARPAVRASPTSRGPRARHEDRPSPRSMPPPRLPACRSMPSCRARRRTAWFTMSNPSRLPGAARDDTISSTLRMTSSGR